MSKKAQYIESICGMCQSMNDEEIERIYRLAMYIFTREDPTKVFTGGVLVYEKDPSDVGASQGSGN